MELIRVERKKEKSIFKNFLFYRSCSFWMKSLWNNPPLQICGDKKTIEKNDRIIILKSFYSDYYDIWGFHFYHKIIHVKMNLVSGPFIFWRDKVIWCSFSKFFFLFSRWKIRTFLLAPYLLYIFSSTPLKGSGLRH